MDVGLAEPQRPDHHQREGRDDGETDREFVSAFHPGNLRTGGAGAISSGCPSMNWRTTGSVVRPDLRHRPDLANDALVEHGDPVADGERAAHVVGDHETGHAEIPGSNHELVHDRRRDGIEPGGRLVVENVAWPERDRPRDAGALPHSAGQLRRIPIGRAVETDHGEALLDPQGDLLLRKTALDESQPDVLTHRHRVEERGELKDESDAPAELRKLLAVHLLHRLAVDLDRAGVGLEERHDHLERDALPGPRAPDDDGVLAARHLQVHAGEHLVGAEGFRQPLELDHESGKDGLSVLASRPHSSTSAQNASSTRMASQPSTTARVVERPTPSAPPWASSPHTQPISATAAPKLALLSRPNQMSLK